MILLISVFFAIEKHHFCNMAVCLLIHFSRSCFKRVANMKKKKGSNFRTNCGCGLSNVRALYLCFFLRTFAIAIIYRVCWFAPNFLFPFSNGINDGFFFWKTILLSHSTMFYINLHGSIKLAILSHYCWCDGIFTLLLFWNFVEIHSKRKSNH